MITVLALDPGETTGWCIVRIEQKRIIHIEAGQAVYSPADLCGMLDSIRPYSVVAEEFTYRSQARPGLVLFSRNLLGVSQMWCDLHDCSFREQRAADAMAFFTNAKLKQLGCYSVGKDHARDATRHALYYLYFKRGSQLWIRDLKTLPPLEVRK